MEEMGGKYVTPYFGYYPPDPNCQECNGTGKVPLKIVFEPEKAKQVWIGICPICSETAQAIYLEYEGVNGPPQEYDFYDIDTKEYETGRRPKCPNKDCPNEFATWVPYEG